MNVIILGANGMMGSMMSFVGSQIGHSYTALSRNEFNAVTDSIERLDIWCKSPCCIVNCIGAIPQKPYTDSEMQYLNLSFPHTLATFCNNRSIPLIHLSTNCVFSGKNSCCMETDMKDADDVYGKSKAEGEPTYGLVLRSSIIGPEKDTAFGLLEWYLQNSSSEIQGYRDHYWNGLTTYHLAKTLYEIIHCNNIPRSAVWHYFSQDTMSKYKLLKCIKTIFQKGPTIQSVNKGTKHYTLYSGITSDQPHISQQIEDMCKIYSMFKDFHRKQS